MCDPLVIASFIFFQVFGVYTNSNIINKIMYFVSEICFIDGSNVCGFDQVCRQRNTLDPY